MSALDSWKTNTAVVALNNLNNTVSDLVTFKNTTVPDTYATKLGVVNSRLGSRTFTTNTFAVNGDLTLVVIFGSSATADATFTMDDTTSNPIPWIITGQPDNNYNALLLVNNNASKQVIVENSIANWTMISKNGWVRIAPGGTAAIHRIGSDQLLLTGDLVPTGWS